jgi:hypothetical protein
VYLHHRYAPALPEEFLPEVVVPVLSFQDKYKKAIAINTNLHYT